MLRYHETAITAIQRFGGYVQPTQGDAVVAYFGYPVAHEQAADRAIRAGLAIIDGLATVDSGIGDPLRARVGIASGLVVVSHILAPDKTAIGETPNLAQRLETAARPGEVMVSQQTRALARGEFEYEDRGLRQLKGMKAPVPLWRVVCQSNASTRFDAATRGRLTPMVGRDAEVDLLLDRWELARMGKGQIILLQGEPGIGKSRMLRAFLDRLSGRIELPLQYQCSPYYSSSAYYPIIDHLQRTLGLVRAKSDQEKLVLLEHRLIDELGFARAHCQLLAHLLSIPCSARYGDLKLSPQRQKDDTIRTLVDIGAAIAQRQATVILFEDVHWADPTTLEVLDAFVKRTESLPLLTLITLRPELLHNWPSGAHLARIALNKLNRQQSAILVSKVAEGGRLPADLVGEIVDKTDGVPLFLEELTKAVLESNLVVLAGDRYEYTATVDTLSIPATLRDSLMARLDRLFPVKELAQIGAVIGREFSHRLLAMIARLPEPQLTSGMDKLVNSELIFRRGQTPNVTYLFKHALVKDAAYESLLKSKRSQLHEQIARTLEREFPATVNQEPEVLAHHLTAAGLHEQAVHYWILAGQRASNRVALAESATHLTTALQVNARLPPSRQRDLVELDIRMLLGTVKLSFKGHASLEVLEAIEPARRLAIAHQQDARLVPILFYLWMHHTARLELGQGRLLAEDLDILSKASGDSYAYIVARNVENMTYGWMGEFTRARHAAEAGVLAYDFDQHSQFVRVYNHDQKCGILSWHIHFLWLTGFPDQAQRAAEEEVSLARKIGHPFNLSFSLTTGCAALVQRGELTKARQWVEEARDIGNESAIGYVTRFFAVMWSGMIEVADGQYEEGYANLTSAWEYFASGGGRVLGPMVFTAKAVAAMNMGRLDEADELLAEADALINKTDHRMHEAEVHRVRGLLCLKWPNPDRDAAEGCFKESLRVAQRQTAKGLELRAALALATFWVSRGNRTGAKELLAPLYLWFTEGLETRDLSETRHLLEELGYPVNSVSEANTVADYVRQ
jgi:predicted ATPase